MKTAVVDFLLIVLCCLVLSSCQPTAKNISSEMFDLSTLPTHWVMLTKTDSGLVVFNSCDVGNLLLTITNKNNRSEILLHGLQEDYNLGVQRVSILPNDTILVQTTRKSSLEIRDFRFVWVDKEMQLARWIIKCAFQLLGFAKKHLPQKTLKLFL